MAENTFTGGCLCGGVRYEASGPASNLCFCHCESCRRAAGAPLVAWATFARVHFRIARGELAEYASSAQVVRGFCGRCGTSLTYRHEARTAEIDVTLASLDDPTRLAPQMHVWAGDKLPWISLDDGRPQLAAGTGGPA